MAIETNLFREGAFHAEVRRRQAAGLGPDLMLLPGSTASALVEADLARGLVVWSPAPVRSSTSLPPGQGPATAALLRARSRRTRGGERAD